MNKLLLASTLVIGSALASGAMAAKAQSGFILGGNAGLGALSSPTTGTWAGNGNGTIDANANHKNFGLYWDGHLGYNFALSQSWMMGLEAVYGDTGRANFGAASNRVTFYQHFLAGLVNITYMTQSGFNFFLKGGPAGVWQYSSYNGSKKKRKGVRAMVVLGAGYQFAISNSMNMNIKLSVDDIIGRSYNNASKIPTNLQSTSLINSYAIRLGIDLGLPM